MYGIGRPVSDGRSGPVDLAAPASASWPAGSPPSAALYRAIGEHPLILRARALTTRRATQLDALATARERL